MTSKRIEPTATTQNDFTWMRAVPVLEIVGQTPCKEQLETLIKLRPIGVKFRKDNNGQLQYRMICDVKVIDMNCLAYVSHTNTEGKPVRVTLHSVARDMDFKQNCTNSLVKAGDGTLHLLECVVVFL
ncbi:hypothetical protein PRIPAC_95305 [Pristionchus pacificus]|uniref:Uncharacterized protein n=1 Tax=Pristionchus pacificus TaxID=54126 RepID=A0A2A6B2V0_PRIPA|nr:hypothetical protein PRIPAC_95305 [Pristionchus pacificus]|eukprot:PDM60205.1 hypothetical protein PRIPAC_54030 [Pristionchus pacificus]